MLIPMSDRDIQRLKILNDVHERRLSQTDAASILHLSTRQIRRLLHKLNKHGARSLIHAARGRHSNHHYPESFRYEILNVVRAQYFRMVLKNMFHRASASFSV